MAFSKNSFILYSEVKIRTETENIVTIPFITTFFLLSFSYFYILFFNNSHVLNIYEYWFIIFAKTSLTFYILGFYRTRRLGTTVDG